jgi:ribosomal protein S27AE
MADWGGLRAVIDARREPEPRSDCPKCGSVLAERDGVFDCPMGHFTSNGPPRD